MSQKHQHGQTRHTEVSKWRFLVGKLACWVLLSANVCKTQLQLLLRKNILPSIDGYSTTPTKSLSRWIVQFGGPHGQLGPFQVLRFQRFGTGIRKHSFMDSLDSLVDWSQFRPPMTPESELI